MHFPPSQPGKPAIAAGISHFVRNDGLVRRMIHEIPE